MLSAYDGREKANQPYLRNHQIEFITNKINKYIFGIGYSFNCCPVRAFDFHNEILFGDKAPII